MQQFHGGVRRMHGDIARHVEQAFQSFEDDSARPRRPGHRRPFAQHPPAPIRGFPQEHLFFLSCLVRLLAGVAHYKEKETANNRSKESITPTTRLITINSTTLH